MTVTDWAMRFPKVKTTFWWYNYFPPFSERAHLLGDIQSWARWTTTSRPSWTCSTRFWTRVFAKQKNRIQPSTQASVRLHFGSYIYLVSFVVLHLFWRSRLMNILVEDSFWETIVSAEVSCTFFSLFLVTIHFCVFLISPWFCSIFWISLLVQ